MVAGSEAGENTLAVSRSHPVPEVEWDPPSQMWRKRGKGSGESRACSGPICDEGQRHPVLCGHASEEDDLLFGQARCYPGLETPRAALSQGPIEG